MLTKNEIREMKKGKPRIVSQFRTEELIFGNAKGER